MSTTLLIVGLLLLLFILYSFYTVRRTKNMEELPESKKIVTLTSTNFDNQVKNGIVLVDFWASWCMPCKMLAPVINEIAEEASDIAKVCKLNVDEQRDIVAKYSVRGIPTLILFKNGKEVKRFVGVKTKGFYLKQIQEQQ